ncbi:polysaccharide biosynthesis protein [Aestuariibaculum suncheonense]|uniref:Polysaccharide biosynthesis protein n=1 Tax=Aestuariibaculum suncheonense TaxID=1028745 RepID=A0A8J6Q6C1_9FLAO|nr:polysaccharide biosynthesis protein [Aestuariibaculum suncheonense]MBD0835508.1 polysaccharide biosynthesis protein [Aestuariibaculum suncheonense]
MKSTIDYYIDQLINHTNLFDSNINTFDSEKTLDFTNEVILITGAAGTIGEELFRQLTGCQYQKIILVDIAESALYNLSIEFQKQITDAIVFKVANLNDFASIKHIFETYKPTMVFHCAAYKHVPLMEVNPYEAVKTNILATKELADLSTKHQVETFVFISSDKAVEPTSIMGMTKNIAEQYLNNITSDPKTKFTITRFGNILGSSGSVLPVFLKQIELNLPVTITSKDMTRFFIGKQKACQLILESTRIKNLKNNTLIFSKSQPVKISDLAKSVISISKKENLTIEVTGIRSGEKMHETMISVNETLAFTEHPDIFLIEDKKKSAKKIADFKSLENITPNLSTQEVESILRAFL